MVLDAHDAVALAELSQELGAASGGDRKLDLKLEYCVGVTFQQRADVARLMVDEGFSWQHVNEALDDRIPLYTTTLDAALPGENIVFVLKSERRGGWCAVHRSEDGRDHLVWAATECLARRLAAVTAWRAEAARGVERSLAEAIVPDAGPEGEDAGPEEEKDWKVMF